jgi:flagellin
MAVVNTNISASIAQSALAKNERALADAMEQLSTGKKINSASDNAAGLAISTRMTSQIRGIDQAILNGHDAVSMISTAEGALDEITAMLQRIRELALQSGTGTTDSSDRSYLNAEFQELLLEIDRIADNTQWNGRDILDGTAGGGNSLVSYQVGVNPSQTVSLAFGNFTNAGVGVMASLSTQYLSTATVASAIARSSNVILAADVAIEAVSTQRATFGAATNRLTHAIDNLTNVLINAEATRSRILDTDYAAATSELARTQIIQQAGTAMLAQANQLPSSVLQLLQN